MFQLDFHFHFLFVVSLLLSKVSFLVWKSGMLFSANTSVFSCPGRGQMFCGSLFVLQNKV